MVLTHHPSRRDMLAAAPAGPDGRGRCCRMRHHWIFPRAQALTHSPAATIAMMTRRMARLKS